MRMILILIISAAATAATLGGCGSEEEGERPVVVASTGIVADITAEVAANDVEVVQLIPDSASPHDFQPSAEEREQLAEADLVVHNGGGLDGSVPLDDTDAQAWALADHIPDPIPFGEAGDASEHAEEEAHGSGASQDPHVWMDPTRVAAALPSLATALAKVAPRHASALRRRAGAFAASLRRLDAEIAAGFEVVPAGDRELVTSHDALAYFADRYGLEVVATPFPATGAEAEPSAAALNEVIQAVDATGTRVLFAEETDDPEVLESIAGETGAIVVDELLVESPGSAGSYEEMLRHDGELIASALGR